MSYSEKDGASIYNNALLVDRSGAIAGRYRKTHMSRNELTHYTRADEFPVFETELGRIGIAICYDRQFPEMPRLLAGNGAQVIVNPTAGVWGQKDEARIAVRACENQVSYIWVHPVHAVAANRWGDTLGGNIKSVDTTQLTPIDIPVPEDAGPLSEMWAGRRPELYGPLTAPCENRF